jgi:hypothetical protein
MTKNLGGRPSIDDSVKRLRNTFQPSRAAVARARKRGATPLIPGWAPPIWWSAEMCETFAERVEQSAEAHGDWPAEKLLDHIEGMAVFYSFTGEAREGCERHAIVPKRGKRRR